VHGAAHEPDPAPSRRHPQAGHPAAHRPPARRLPSDHPSTVARALADLEREGLSRPPGARHLSHGAPARRPAARSLERSWERAWTRARRLGFTGRESWPPSQRVARRGGRRSRSGRVSSWMQSCRLTRYRDELEPSCPCKSTHACRGVEARVIQGRRSSGYRVVITTFFHIHEVRRIMRPMRTPSVALLAEAASRRSCV